MLTVTMLAAPFGVLAAVLVHGGPFWRGVALGLIVGAIWI